MTFALLMAGAIAGFLAGVGVGWHARPSLVEVRVTDAATAHTVQASDNEIVRFTDTAGHSSYRGPIADALAEGGDAA